jgi:hypothetical protein
MIPARNADFNSPLMLLGPQQSEPRLRQALNSWGITGPVGLIAAGWEEDEFDDGWVHRAVDNTVVNSRLYDFAEQLFVEDPEVIYLLRRRQDDLRKLREVNKIQLDHLLSTARELLRREFVGEDVAAEATVTFKQIREVDSLYIDLVHEVIRKYDKQIEPTTRTTVLDYRKRVLERLNGCQALLIAGGHIGVLLNRLNLSRLLKHIHVPIIAWSGGAMAMGEKIVFYHHFIPHSSGDAELSRHGMRWFRSMLLFPAASQRLNLASRIEIALLARRFSDDVCYAMDDGSRIEWSSDQIVGMEGINRLSTDGYLVRATQS